MLNPSIASHKVFETMPIFYWKIWFRLTRSCYLYTLITTYPKPSSLWFNNICAAASYILCVLPYWPFQYDLWTWAIINIFVTRFTYSDSEWKVVFQSPICSEARKSIFLGF